MGLVSYKKRLQKDPLALPTMKGHKKKPLAMSQEEGPHKKATMLVIFISDFPGSTLMA